MHDMLEELGLARRDGEPVVLATIIHRQGSIPREVGAKMLVYADRCSGTIGGGKFEALVIDDARTLLESGEAKQYHYPLHEAHEASFGAICGGEVTVFLEPFRPARRLLIVGGGHCGVAIAKLGRELGFQIVVFEDRPELQAEAATCYQWEHASFPAGVSLRSNDALILVSRNFHIDRDALRAALALEPLDYMGMIGSRKKVKQVFEELRSEGISDEQLDAVHAPIGLDIGAESPSEIAVSVLAQVLQVTRRTSGGSMRL